MDPDEDDEGQEKTPGDGLLNDDWKWFANAKILYFHHDENFL
jgi:hypothetical protein